MRGVLFTAVWYVLVRGVFFSYFTAVWYVLDTYETCDSKREDKIMETLFEKVMELDSLMEEGYRGARANINLLQ